MKKTNILTLACAFCLLSCGNASATGASEDEELKAKRFFDSYEASGIKGLSGDALGVMVKNGKLNAALKSNPKDEESTDYTVRVEPLSFEARFGGLKETSFDNLSFSLVGETPYARNGSKIFIDGLDILDGALPSGIPLDVNAYLQGGVLYLDMYKSGLLRRAINEAFKDEYPDWGGLPSRGHYDFESEDKTEAEKELPMHDKLVQAPMDIRAEMDKIYAASKSEFSFLEAGEEKTISFATTSWASLENIVNAFDLPTDIAKEDVTSFFDKAKESADITKCAFSFTFDNDAWRVGSVDLALSFKEPNPEDELQLVGDWNFACMVDFRYGEDATPIKLTATEISNFKNVITLPKKAEEEA